MVELAFLAVYTASASHPCPTVSPFASRARGSERVGMLVLRDPRLLLLVDQNLVEKSVNLLTHLFVRSLLFQVPAFVAIEVSEPIFIELPAF